MSIGINDLDPDDPELKLARGGVGGRGSPIPGGGGLPAAFGFGGGSVFGGPETTSFGTDGALRTLLRKRLALPAATPSYLSGGTTFAESGSRPGATPAASVSGILGRSGMFGTNRVGTGVGQVGGQTTGPSEWTPEGANPSGDPTIGLNDWSGTGWDQSRTLNQLYDLLKQFSDFGSFSPTGSSGLMDATRSEALSNADALRGRNKLISSNVGADPSTSASYALQSDLNTQGGVADALNSAVLGRLESQDAFGKDLLSMLASLNAQDWMAERQGDISKRYAPDQGGGWGSTLGGIAGAGIGGYFGGPWGASAGNRIGSKLFGG